MNSIQKTGSCLCGEIRFVAKSVVPSIHACHCEMCRKWGGGPSLSVHCGADISFSGDENISEYESSEWANRGFCRKCGTHIFCLLKETNEYIVPVGLFDSSQGLIFAKQIFIDKKPDYYSFGNETEDLTGDEVIEQASSPPG